MLPETLSPGLPVWFVFSPGSFGPDYVSETLEGTCESLSLCFWCEAKDFKIADLASRKKKSS